MPTPDRNSIVVVEPHADDAFLSCGAHLAEWVKLGWDVYIWTVFSGTRKRAADAEAYARAIGAKWIGSGLVEEEDKVADHFDALKAQMPNVNSIVLPIAVTHPEHFDVRAEFELMDLLPQFNTFYYLDQPYAITQKNGERVTDQLRGHRVISYRKPGARKFRHIPLFKDQAKFFHYNPAEKLMQTMELLVG